MVRKIVLLMVCLTMPGVHYHLAYCIRSIWIVFVKGMVIGLSMFGIPCISCSMTMPGVHYHLAYCIRSIWIVFVKGMVIGLSMFGTPCILCTNYALKAFNLLAQEKFLLSLRLAKQLRWSYTMNSSGLPGKNMPCDLHMEYFNHEYKIISLCGKESHITDHSVQRI